jgi:ketosteroid isomerase-like protein
VPRSLTGSALEFVRAFNEGDLDAFNSVLDPNIEIHSSRGVRAGRDAARAWATRAPGGVQQTIEVTATSENETEVLLTVDRHWHWDVDGGHAATDELSWLLGTRDGMICSWRSFEDRQGAEQAFREDASGEDLQP